MDAGKLSTIARHAGLSTGKKNYQRPIALSTALATLVKYLGVLVKSLDRLGKDPGICG